MNQQKDTYALCFRCDAVRHVRKLQETIAFAKWDCETMTAPITAFVCAEGCTANEPNNQPEETTI